MLGTLGHVPRTRHTIRFIALVLLIGTALASPTLASAAFLQLVGNTQNSLQAWALPEPASLTLLGCALAGTAWMARRAHPRRQSQ